MTGTDRAARALLVLLLAGWGVLALWLVRVAPFRSGTDESIAYVAFAAAQNRWAGADDFRRFGVEHFYYAPLYYLCFAPFWGAEPAFVEAFPRGPHVHPHFAIAGGRQMVSDAYLRSVPPPLDRLYRSAKLFGAALGLLALLALVFASRRLMPGPGSWTWTLVATAPALLLPQFLYYQTLCNNDTLVNALSAGATASFVAALAAAREGRLRRSRALGAGCAGFVGLALLTKLTGATLLPLLPALAASAAWSASAAPGERLRIAGLQLAGLLAIVIATGGFWILAGFLGGDPLGLQAHRLAHPWAFVAEPLWQTWGWPAFLSAIVRSYFAMFTGGAYGIPDPVLFLYMLLPGAVVCLGAIRALRHFGARSGSAVTDGGLAWAIAGLVGTVALNMALVVAHCRQVNAPYGRLLFPSLVAGHLLFGLLLRTLYPRHGTATLAVVLGLQLPLFGWVVSQRLVPAVRQADESLVPLVPVTSGSAYLTGPVWQHEIEQPVVLPPGTLSAFRVWIGRSPTPMLGGSLSGALELAAPHAGRVELRPAPLDGDWGPERWTELALSDAVYLTGETPGRLFLRGQEPLLPTAEVRYILQAPPPGSRAAPMSVGGRQMQHSLSLSARYVER